MADRKQMNLYFWRSDRHTATEEKAWRQRHISPFVDAQRSHVGTAL